MGRSVVVAASEEHVGRCREYFRGLRVRVIAAPAPRYLKDPPTPITFAHLLLECGFADPRALLRRAVQWRALLDELRPELVLADHSPTVLLACRGRSTPMVSWGTGFECPPLVDPLPSLRPDLSATVEELRRIEGAMLGNLNRVAEQLGAPPLGCVADLLHGVDRQLLLTYPELDPYADREAAEYLGAYAASVGERAEWPAGSGPRVLVYLGVREVLQLALTALESWSGPVLVAGGHVERVVAERYGNERVGFPLRDIDFAAAAREADVVLLNGGHATTVQTLLAGRPAAVVPTTLEKSLTARAVERMGAGVGADLSVESIGAAVWEACAGEGYAAAARGFAERYGGQGDGEWVDAVVERLEPLFGDG